MDRRAVAFASVGAVVVAGSLAAMRSRRPEAPLPYLVPAPSVPRRPVRPLSDTVDGLVRAGAGPASGAQVAWWGVRDGRFGPIATTTAGVDGRFSFRTAKALSSSGCFLFVSYPGFAPALVRRLDLGDGRNVDIALEPAATLDVSLVDSHAAPLAGVAVRCALRIVGVGSVELPGARAVSDAAGAVRVAHLPRNANIEVRIDDLRYAQPAHLLRVATGRDGRRALRRVTLAPAARVRGRVLDPQGHPVAGVRVLALYDDTREPVPGSEVTTDATGGYVLVGLSPRAYILTNEDRGASAAKGWTRSEVRVTVRSGTDLVAPTLQVSAGGVITGRIRDAATGEPVSGLRLLYYRQRKPLEPTPAPAVQVVGGGGMSSAMAGDGYDNHAATAADGSFALCLTPGTWVVSPTPSPNALLPPGMSVPSLVKMTVERGKRTSLDFQWRRIGGMP